VQLHPKLPPNRLLQSVSFPEAPSAFSANWTVKNPSAKIQPITTLHRNYVYTFEAKEVFMIEEKLDFINHLTILHPFLIRLSSSYFLSG
ncbi:hypothetical protein R2R70_20700, partial [Cobetia sp. SIMBA_158]|uniref:hypothetical protein n=1 Tax=Cobetia sp. SIMBA_158 TaxID=3081617 RepID=UPI0039816611